MRFTEKVSREDSSKEEDTEALESRRNKIKNRKQTPYNTDKREAKITNIELENQEIKMTDGKSVVIINK